MLWAQKYAFEHKTETKCIYKRLLTMKHIDTRPQSVDFIFKLMGSKIDAQIKCVFIKCCLLFWYAKFKVILRDGT